MGMEITDGRLVSHSLSSHVDVNHGDGFDMLRICAADRKPVVMFRLNRDAINRKELSFNVIRQGH